MRLGAHLRGHILLFDPVTPPTITANGATRLVAAALLLETARLALVWPASLLPVWLLAPLLLFLALAALRLARGTFRDAGFAPWHAWSLTERSYFVQVVVLAHVVYPLVLAGLLRARMAEVGVVPLLLLTFLPYLLFGFYQEIVYRGLLQTALVHRSGAVFGVLAANLLYTFGPLHMAYFRAPASVAAPMFAAIFAIGLLFGAIYRRSGNLWIVATMHAIGNAFAAVSLGGAP